MILAAVVTGCIKNDIPYPRIQPNFMSFEVENQRQATEIDTINRTITVYLNEEADIQNVILTGYNLSPAGAVWADSTSFFNGKNLSRPVFTTVSLYQDYTWRVNASQTIERYFTLDRQVGTATIDPEGHRVIAYVTESSNLSAILVKTIKLAGPQAVMEPDLAGQTVDFNSPVEVNVTEFGRTVTWTIYVSRTESAVTTDRVDPWACIAWVYGTAEAGKENGVEYRSDGSDEWIRLPESDITHTGGSFCGRISGLIPETKYVARAYSGSDLGEEIPFTTEGTAQLPNSDFENWWLDGKVWCPWTENGDPWWGTGNKGATTLGPSNTYPVTDTPTGEGRAAQLETKFVGIGALGKLAAGNIFAGSYVRTEGTNGVLSFGRQFNLHPTKLKGWYKYHSAPISSVTAGFTDLKDRPDTAIIWIALIDAPQPVEIRTNPNNRNLFNPNSPDVVAYGEMTVGHDVNSYEQFEITLDYRSTSRIPTYVLVVSSASKYGDYFTGGNGSILNIDDFKLEYD